MKKALFLLILAVSVVGLCLPVRAQSWWRTGGPIGGLGYDVRIHPLDPNIMFVTDNPSGVNKSYDKGATWSQRNNGIDVRTGSAGDAIPIFCLTIDPGNPNIVWAGTQYSKGLYKSTDGGETWAKKVNGITEGEEISFRGIAIHPEDSNTVLAAAEIGTGSYGPFGLELSSGKIYKSTDGGESWRPVWQGGALARVLIYDYNNPDTVFCSTGIFDREPVNGAGSGVLKSVDGGETWVESNIGLDLLQVGFLEMHPTDPQTLYAAGGSFDYCVQGALYKTTDSGSTWSRVLTASQSNTMAVATISKSDPDVVYAGDSISVYRSDNGGATWKEYQNSQGSYGPEGVSAGVPISAVVDPQNPMTVYINNYIGGVFRSTDGGRNWSDWSTGYTGAQMLDVDISSNNPALVYALARTGPSRSTDGGATWQGLLFGETTQAWFAAWNTIAVSPTDSNLVLLADQWRGVIFKSTNGGFTWKAAFKNPDVTWGTFETHQGYKKIIFAPSDPSIVYAGMSVDDQTLSNQYPARPSLGMYKSTDAGETWTAINNGLSSSLLNILAIAVHPADPQTVYVGTWRDGVFKTTDGGSTWAPTNNGLGGTEVLSLAIDPNQPDTVYAGLSDGLGVYKSIDGGNTWVLSANGMLLTCPAYLRPVGNTSTGLNLKKPPKIIPIGTYASNQAWTRILDLVVDPVSGYVYASDDSYGVYRSADGGTSWSPLNDGLTTKTVIGLDVSNTGSVVYAATDGGGVFRLGNP